MRMRRPGILLVLLLLCGLLASGVSVQLTLSHACSLDAGAIAALQQLGSIKALDEPPQPGCVQPPDGANIDDFGWVHIGTT
jgi:hypothetical protein